MNIAVVGGDLRQCYLVGTLIELGYHVKAFDLACRNVVEDYGNVICDTLEETLRDCEVLILPIPVSEQWEYVAEQISDETIVFGWNIPANYSNKVCYDFKDMEDVALRNAVATAEGTLAEAIKYGSINITGSKVLVVGYGRCGREIALLFREIGAYVTVADRSKSKREDAAFHGMDSCNMFQGEDFCKFDFVINTVPAPVIGRREIDRLGKDVVIIDIASKPGGTDFAYCKECNKLAIHSLGLPGMYSPKTSGEILGHAVAGIVETICVDRK